MGVIENEFQRWKFQFNLELLIALIILIAPFLIYIHLLFSESSNELDFFLFKWRHGFKHNQLLLWNCLSNFIPLVLILISFLTLNNRIRFFLLPLIIMFSFFLLSDIFYYQSTHFFVNIDGIIIAFLLIILLIGIDRQTLRMNTNNELKVSSKDFLKEIFTLRMAKLLELAEVTKKAGKDIPKIQYLSRLLYYNEIMKKEINKKNGSELDEDKDARDTLVIFILKILLIFSAVAINFVYLLIPDGLNKIDIGGWSLGNMGFGSLDNLAWYLLKKISIVLFLIIWFISAKNWWKMAILTPLIIYSYQIIEVFFDIGDVDAGNNSKILPILFPVIIALLFLIQIVRLKSRLMDYIDQFEKELETEISNISKSE